MQTKQQLLAVLREGVEGSSRSFTYFIDSGGELRATLASLDAGDASKEIGGNSIAAHAHHIRFGSDTFAAWIRGDRARRDWSESWRVSAVNADEWTQLRRDVFASTDALRDAIEQLDESDEAQLGGAIGAIAHLAYHLGAIRQKLAMLR